MTLDKILKLLMDRHGKYVSEKELCESGGMSGISTRKHIKVMRAAGYVIDEDTDKDYKLAGIPDLLLPDLIWYYLHGSNMVKEIKYYDSVGSTNEVAKSHESRCAMPAVVVSEQQLAGKGRITKGWYSPRAQGIYCSLLLHPDVPMAQLSKLTLLVGLAVAKAMTGYGLKPLIKWPNDIVIRGKKVCGILTETSAEMSGIHYVVTGFGININNHSFPDELKDIATSLYIESGRMFNRSRFLACVLKEIEFEYNKYIDGQYDGFINDVKDISATLGRRVRVLDYNKEYAGRAVDILPSGELQIKTDDGDIRDVQAGDVSIRGVMGYV